MDEGLDAVRPVEAAAVAGDQIATLFGTPVSFNPLANDSDTGGGTLRLTDFTDPTGGSVTVDSVTGLFTFTPDPGFAGFTSFRYTVEGSTGGPPATATVQVQVAAGNLIADTATTPALTPITLFPLANDSFLPGSTATLVRVSLTPTSAGSVSFDSRTGAVTFTPGTDFTTATITYFVINSADPFTQEVPLRGTIDLSVEANQPPVVSGDLTGTLTEDDTSVSGALGITDPDAQVQPSFAGASVTGDNGTLSVNAAGTLWTYTIDPADFQSLDDSDTRIETLTLTASDGTKAAIDLTVTGIDDPAVPGGDRRGTLTQNDSTVTGTVFLEDPDAEEGAPYFRRETLTGDHGTLRVAAGHWTYTLTDPYIDALDAGERVVERFTLTATDDQTEADIVVVIEGVEDAGTISGDHFGEMTEDEDEVFGQITVFDPDTADILAFAGATATGRFGRLSVDSTGSFWTYTLTDPTIDRLEENDSRFDSLTLTGTHGERFDVQIRINGVDDPAVVSGRTSATITEDQTAASGKLILTDVDAGDARFDFRGETATGAYGRLSFDQTGQTWTYRVTDPDLDRLDIGEFLVDQMTVTGSEGTDVPITVTILGQDDPAVATGTTALTLTEDSLEGRGSIGLTDPDGPTTASFAGARDRNPFGSIAVNAAGDAWVFRPVNNWFQSLEPGDRSIVRLNLSASDGTLQDITITILGRDDPAVVSGTLSARLTEDTARVTGAIRITDVDEGDDPSFAGARAAGQFGDLAVNATGTGWTYSPDTAALQRLDAGDTVTDRLTVTASDGTAQAILVTIEGRDDAAVVSGTLTARLTEDTARVTGAIRITDVDEGDDPSFAGAVGLPFSARARVVSDAGGTLRVNAAGTGWTYVPDQAALQALGAGESYIDRLTLTASDGTQAGFSFTITGANDAPVAADDAGVTLEDIPITLAPLLNDSDGEGEALRLVSVADPANGTAQVLAGGRILYTPDEGFEGTDPFTVTVADATGARATSTLRVTVIGTDAPPPFDIIGGEGPDLLPGSRADEAIGGEGGDDALLGQDGADTLYGGDGDDGVFGCEDGDTLFGGAGHDYLGGGTGDDRLVGDAGADRLAGNLGADVFVFAPGDGADRILDYTDGTDRIDLSAHDLSFAALRSLARTTQGGLLIDFGDGDSVVVLGLSLARLSAGDFVF